MNTTKLPSSRGARGGASRTGQRPTCAGAVPAMGSSVTLALGEMGELECLRELVRLARASALPHRMLNRREAIEYLGYVPKERQAVHGLKRINNKVWLFHPETFVARTFPEE